MSNFSKHGNSLSILIVSNINANLSKCFYNSKNPIINLLLNKWNILLFYPPNKSIYSFVNLNGADSNFIPPGAIVNIKPKSIWIICP